MCGGGCGGVWGVCGGCVCVPFTFENDGNLFGSTKMGIFYRKKYFTPGKNLENDFPPQENMPVTPLGRTFLLSLFGAKSDGHTLNYGVPQGSIIGAKAFSMYAQSVTTIIRHHGLRYNIYADNIQLYFVFDPSIPSEAAVAIFKLSMCAS